MVLHVPRAGHMPHNVCPHNVSHIACDRHMVVHVEGVAGFAVKEHRSCRHLRHACAQLNASMHKCAEPPEVPPGPAGKVGYGSAGEGVAATEDAEKKAALDQAEAQAQKGDTATVRMRALRQQSYDLIPLQDGPPSRTGKP